MTFSKAEFEAVVAEIGAGLEDFAGKLDRILPVATAAMNRWYIPTTCDRPACGSPRKPSKSADIC